MFWRIYAVVFALVSLINYSVLMKASPGMWDYLDMAISVGALMGFVGFAFEFRIISMNLWKVYFFLAISWDIFYSFIIVKMLDLAVHLPNEEKMTWATLAVSFALLIPEYICLYLYGYRSEPLWEETEAA
jgi:hypothetical protein